jgi:hypothetical protein
MSLHYTTESFKEKANYIHDNKYNYDKAVYINSTTPVIITCPIHGDFEQRPNNHLHGRGCKKCRPKNVVSKMTTDLFIEKANKVHSNKYDYTNSIYTTQKDKVKIVCPIHGEFLQHPGNHLRGSGCPECAKEQTSDKHRSSLEDFVKRANEVHNSFYDYSKFTYVNARTPSTIICPDHGEFSTTMDNHVNKSSGCPVCKKHHSYTDKPTTLYYLKVNNELYKIGITSKDVNLRFGTDIKIIETIFTLELPTGYDAYEIEQRVLIKFKDFKYTGEKVLASGNTELFTKDVLNGACTLEEITQLLSSLE